MIEEIQIDFVIKKEEIYEVVEPISPSILKRLKGEGNEDGLRHRYNLVVSLLITFPDIANAIFAESNKEVYTP